MSEDLRQLAADLRKASIRNQLKAPQVVRKAAFDVVAHAQQLVPVDTGATKNSIDAAFDRGGLAATVGPTTDYAPYLEHGTARMSPRPFMSPAADRVLPGFTQAIAELGGEVL